MSKERRDADDLVSQYGAQALHGADMVPMDSGPSGPGLLEVVVAACEAASEADLSKADTVQPLVDFYRDQSRLLVVASAMATEANEVEGLLLRLRCIPGMSRDADLLRRALTRASRDQKAAARDQHLRAVQDGEQRVLALVLNLDDVQGHALPPGFDIDVRGVWMLSEKHGAAVRTRLTQAPIVVTGRYVDIDDGAEQIKVMWRRKDPSGDADKLWRSAVVPRSTIADSRALIAHADYGAPVTSANSKQVVGWLDAYEGRNLAALPTGWSTRRMGWLGTKTKVFMAGGQVIQGKRTREVEGQLVELPQHNVHLQVSKGHAQLARAVRSGGTEEQWCATIERLKPHPLAMFAVYVSLAAPLVAVLGIDSVGCDWSGTTGTSKTTSLRAGASVWGPPSGGMIQSWGGTTAGIEHAVALRCDHPMILDESNKIPEDRRSGIASFLYMICNGVGRLLGAENNQMREIKSWRTVLMSTGESPITSYSHDEGVRTRVLCIQGAPIPPNNRELVNGIRLDLDRNHGWAGPKLVRWLVEHPEKHAGLKAQYKILCAHFGARANNDQHGRLGQAIALFGLAQQIARDDLGYEWATPEPIEAAWLAVAATQVDRARVAADQVYSWCVSNQRQFYGRSQEHMPPREWYGKWEAERPDAAIIRGWPFIAILPGKLDSMLRRAGFQPAAVRRDWKARGWLMLDGEGKDKRVSVDGAIKRCVCLRREVFADQLGEPGGD